MNVDIVVHVPMHGRTKESRMAFKALDRTMAEFADLGYTHHVCVAGSGQRDQQLAKEHGYEYIDVPNLPVGRKFNTLAAHILRNHRFTWYMEYCSDNVLSPGYALLAHEAIQAGAQGVYVAYFYCVELQGTKCKKFGPGMSNVGRLTKGDAVRAYYNRTYELYPVHKNNRLDQAFRRRMVLKSKVEYQRIDGPENVMLLDVKGPLNINPMSNFTGLDSVHLKGEFPEYYEINPAWQPQEKSGQTRLESTSPPPLTPTTTPESAEPTGTTAPPKRTPSNSLPVQPAEASPRRRKSSKRPRRTTTASAKS